MSLRSVYIIINISAESVNFYFYREISFIVSNTYGILVEINHSFIQNQVRDYQIMKLLEEKIRQEGQALSETVLKVDSFVNHQVDPVLMQEIGHTFAQHYRGKGITKVFTIESSGIAPALTTALELGVPMVILKKQTTKVLNGDVYQTNITSFTKGTSYELTLSAKYIQPDDKILIIDDFLANGEAASGASRLVEEAGASISGIGILIEKSFQKGRKRLEDAGYDVCSLVRISRLGRDLIEFAEADI